MPSDHSGGAAVLVVAGERDSLDRGGAVTLAAARRRPLGSQVPLFGGVPEGSSIVTRRTSRRSGRIARLGTRSTRQSDGCALLRLPVTSPNRGVPFAIRTADDFHSHRMTRMTPARDDTMRLESLALSMRWYPDAPEDWQAAAARLFLLAPPFRFPPSQDRR